MFICLKHSFVSTNQTESGWRKVNYIKAFKKKAEELGFKVTLVRCPLCERGEEH